jgi:PAS domain S-box-containing protein
MNGTHSIAAAPPDPGQISIWLRAALFGLVYFFSALLGRYLIMQGNLIVGFWLPAALYVAALLLSPTRAWLPLIVAALLADAMFDRWNGIAALLILFFCCANTVQALSSALLFRRFVSSTAAELTLRSVFGMLTFAVLLGPALGALISAIGWQYVNPDSSFVPYWKIWWAGNAVAILLFLPLILSWFAPSARAFSLHLTDPARIAEAALLSVGMLGLTYYLLVDSGGLAGPFDSRLMPFLLWAGLRFGVRGATAASAALALAMTLLLTQGYTPLLPSPISSPEYLFRWQVFLATNALVALIPAVVLEERNRTVAALHQSQARFRQLTDAAFEGICIIENGRLIEVNEQLLAMMGFARAEMLGRPCTDFIAAESREAVAEALRHGEETIGEHCLLRRDGSNFHVEARTRLSVSGDQRLRMMAIRDISDRKQAEDAIRGLNAELERRVAQRTAQLSAANKELEAFSYSVSHDLRAPLRHIAGYAEMLKENVGPLNEEATHQFSRIIGAVTRMGAIVGGLLTLSHLGRTELHKADVSLSEVLQEAREQLAHETRDRNIEWQIDALPIVHADPTLLREALVNLLHNAIKYSAGRDPAHIHVGMAPEKAQDNEIVVFIRDNGAGFDMRYVHKLFGMFQRLHSDLEFEGTGIGLANVQRIINRHDGRIWTESVVNEGATFYFSLPKSASTQ